MTILTTTETHTTFGALLDSTGQTVWLVHSPDDEFGGPIATSLELLLELHAQDTDDLLHAPCIVSGADVYLPTPDGGRHLAMTRLAVPEEARNATR